MRLPWSPVALLPLLLLCAPARGQGGALDPTFGDGGRVTVSVGAGPSEIANAVVLMPDGRVIAAGHVFGSGLPDAVAVVRLLPDGAPDPSFGRNGRVSFDAAGINGQASAVLVQPDGRVVVAGRVVRPDIVEWRPFVARLTADGRLDDSFGADGLVTPYDEYGGVHALALDDGGRIVAIGSAGTDGPHRVWAARLLPSGAPDESFGTGGLAGLADGPDAPTSLAAVAVDPSGRIVAAGRAPTGYYSNGDVLALRLTPDGAPDPSFGTGGRARAGWDGYHTANGYALAVDASGRVVVGGEHADDYAVVRFTPDGALDASFGEGGRATFDGGQTGDRVHALALDADGRVVLAGTQTTHLVGEDIAVLRLTADGALDPAFGDGGRAVFDSGSEFDYGYALALRPDGRPLVAGGSERRRADGNGTHFDVALVQLTTAGELDPAFGDGGVAFVGGVGPGPGEATAVAALPDGRVVLAGHAEVNGEDLFAAVRLTPSGAPDPTFGDGGRVTVPFGGLAYPSAAALQPDGRLVVAGTVAYRDETPARFGVVRLDADGALDGSFGDGGRATVPFASYASATGVAVQPDGRIVLVGRVDGAGVAVVGLSADGTPDPSFGADGRVLLEDGRSSLDPQAVALDASGRVVVVGERSTGADRSMFAVRLLADGAPDPSFDGDGVATVEFDGDEAAAEAVALGPDGSVLLAGVARERGTAARDVAAARLTPSGALDAAFGDGGRVRVGLGGEEGADAVVLDGTGRVVLAGTALGPTGQHVAVVRLNADGSRDGLFGDGGLLTVDVAGDGDRASALTLDGEGRLLVAGTAGESEREDFAVVRLLPGGPVAVEPGGPPEPALALAAGPNPTPGPVRVAVDLREPGPVRVEVLDVRGRRLAVLHDGPLAAGAHPFSLDGSALPAGTYLVQATAGGQRLARAVTVVR